MEDLLQLEVIISSGLFVNCNSGVAVEKLFEKSHLKWKPNRWFKKATPTYYVWNEVEQTSANFSDKEIHF